MKWTHIDLFSGIGGGALAADQVWGKEKINHIFCDNEPFAQQVLKKHWPESRIFGDIRQFSKEQFTTDARSEELGRVSKQPREESIEIGDVYILTGGFPCQPFSQAGRRKGTNDDRHLWPEMFRVIREFRPKWIVGENVAGFVTWSDGLVLRQVFSDLEGAGYEVEAFVIPACAVDAPHRRDRVWIIAHATSQRRTDGFDNREERYVQTDQGTSKENKSERERRKRGIGKVNANASDAGQFGAGNESARLGVGSESGDPKGKRTKKGNGLANENISNSNSKIERGQRDRRTRNGGSGFENEAWDQNWIEVATRLCRVDDGVPTGLDRNKRLKALGNAWVPQVAIEIFKAIKEVDSL